MSNDIRQSELGAYILPVLCGNTATARRLSAKILRRLGTVSLICGRSRWLDLLDPTFHLLRLPKMPSDRLIVEALTDVATAYPDRLPVLIPCSEEARRLIDSHRTVLETRYLIREADCFFDSPPVAEGFTPIFPS